MVTPRFLIVVLADYAQPGIGGGNRHACELFRAIQDEAAYVFATRDPDLPVGRWIRRVVRGVPHQCFAVTRLADGWRRPIVPGRVSDYLALQRHRKAILSSGIRSALVLAPESLLALSRWNFRTLCYLFPGIENPLERSRYRLGRALAARFDRAFFRALRQADVILAGADQQAIAAVMARSRGEIAPGRVRMFPTSVDMELFSPRFKAESRRELGIGETDRRILLFCGRLNRVKGWDLVLAAFQIACDAQIADELWIAGDGEDRRLVERAVRKLGLSNKVRLLGAVPPDSLPAYYNAADLVVVGSVYEGWSQTMLEAIACGKPVVSTDVSGASHLVQDGLNGFVVPERNPHAFAKAVEAALALPDAASHSVRICRPYASENLRARLFHEWTPLG